MFSFPVNSRDVSEAFILEENLLERIIKVSRIGNSSADFRPAVHVDLVCFTSDLLD